MFPSLPKKQRWPWNKETPAGERGRRDPAEPRFWARGGLPARRQDASCSTATFILTKAKEISLFFVQLVTLILYSISNPSLPDYASYLE
ncbi:hypothetical protein N782_14830 [Pontibacillus yanchengensis Y32]|uniref:Uncharacterized protein n=1 Tax=Pontibacillus yanchengensis Y32 TaxID=1385514 RepID=A0A0A2T817_9BACI|nr:hypothetical protein N782_14830 [Pontibacillus yanchengensis Y32]